MNITLQEAIQWLERVRRNRSKEYVAILLDKTRKKEKEEIEKIEMIFKRKNLEFLRNETIDKAIYFLKKIEKEKPTIKTIEDINEVDAFLFSKEEAQTACLTYLEWIAKDRPHRVKRIDDAIQNGAKSFVHAVEQAQLSEFIDIFRAIKETFEYVYKS